MIKRNFLTGDSVIYSPSRMHRPKIKCKEILTTPKDNCPFCLENANLTFEPIYKDFDEEIRVINNKYPIFDINIKDLYGFHYLIIDTKDHYKQIQDYSLEHITRVLKAIQNTISKFYLDHKIKYVQVFKNQGINSGASQSHSHWQIMGLPIIPLKQNKIVQAFHEYSKSFNGCYLCDLNIDKVLVEKTDFFVSFCPEDALYSYEINIMPKSHVLSLVDLNEAQILDLGLILISTIKKLNLLCENIDYNICLYSSFKTFEHHFFIQIIPRLGNFAGFEFSTGMYVNSVSSESAATFFKNPIN